MINGKISLLQEQLMSWMFLSRITKCSFNWSNFEPAQLCNSSTKLEAKQLAWSSECVDLQNVKIILRRKCFGVQNHENFMQWIFHEVQYMIFVTWYNNFRIFPTTENCFNIFFQRSFFSSKYGNISPMWSSLNLITFSCGYPKILRNVPYKMLGWIGWR